MPEILCPHCKHPVSITTTLCTCDKGHEFPVKDNIIDFLPNMDDKELKEEEKHWDHYAQQGKANIEPNEYIKSKIFRDYVSLYGRYISEEWPDFSQKNVSIAEIGCGSGSGIKLLLGVKFPSVDYVGMDISLQTMLAHRDSEKHSSTKWKVRFVRASATTGLFKENSLDMVFSTSALHHLKVDEVIKWTSKSLKPGGLFIMNEPSEVNPFARLGRKFVKDFHTKGERPLHPKKIEKIANEHGLHLSYEKGLHFLSGPMMYLVEILRFPMPLSIVAYVVSKFFDNLVISPSWNYSFIQVYRRA